MQKKHVFLVLLLVVTFLPVKGQWNRFKTAHTDLIDDVSVVNDNVMWLTDTKGLKYSITKDGGKTWVQKTFPTTMSSNSAIGGLTGINDSTAYVVVGDGTAHGVYKTIDGGNNWIRQTSMFNNASSYPDFVCFWNETEGVAVGDVIGQYFEIYTTTDGGKTWTAVSSTSMPIATGDYTYNRNYYYKQHGNAMYFVTGKGRIMKTTNKGLKWKYISTPLTSGTGMDVEFRDETNGIMNNGSKQYCTTDSGKTWIAATLANMYGRVKYFDSKNMYVSTSTTTGLSYSTDNGASWKVCPQVNNIGLGVAACTPSGRIVAGSTGYFYTTNNCAGENLKTVSMHLTGSNTMDVLFSKSLDAGSAENTSNFSVFNYLISKANSSSYKHFLTIKSVKLDTLNKSLIHVETQEVFPTDTVRISISHVFDTTGYGFVDPDGVSELWDIYSLKNVTAGNLSTVFSADELTSIVKLKLKGTIDARDFKTIRDLMPNLNNLDLSETDIVGYKGTEGTRSTDVMTYPANTVPHRAFLDCDKLGQLILPATTTAFESTTFYSCSNLRQLIIPKGVKSIGGYAFFECSSLDSLYLPTGLTKIENNTFQGCGNLKIKQLPDSLTSIGAFAFSSCSSLRKILIPLGVTEVGNNAFESCGLDTVQINSNLKTIAVSAFDNCTNLRNINIPSSVKSIGNNAFFNCYSLGILNFPDSIVTIGSGAFQGTGLANITLPALLESIGNDAFSGVGTLRTVTFGNHLKTLGNSVFSYCYRLNEVKMPNSVKHVGTNLFDNCQQLKTLVLSDSLQNIGGNMFNACDSLKTLPPLPASLISIDSWAFNNCYQLKELIIPETVTNIGSKAFNACVNLEKLVVPKMIQSIPASMVEQCGKLKEFIIPPTVTSIGDWAFASCRSLTEIKIPNRVTAIGDYAFAYCTGMKALRVSNSKPVDLSFMSNAFNGIDYTLCTLYLPTGTKSKYLATNVWYNFKNIVENGTSLLTTPDIVYLSNQQTDRLVIYVKSNSSWKVSVDQTWLSLNKSTGLGNDSVVVSVDKNNDYFRRISALSFVADSVSMYSLIYQNGSQKTIACTAGNLKYILSEAELASLTNIKLTGDIDARDFRTMRDKMPLLREVDLAATNVKLYSGYEGTYNDTYTEYNTTYQANAIPQLAFRRSGLSSIVAPKSISAIENSGFQSCSDVRVIDLPAGLRTIGNDVFNSCTSLIDITLPSAVTSLGTSAFSSCTNLRSLKLPDNISTIGANMFYYCNALLKVTIPNSVKTIEMGAFFYCRGLKEITLSTKLQSINSSAFFNCDSLTSISLPASLKMIDANAFCNCSALQSIYAYMQDPTSIYTAFNGFDGVSRSTCYLYVPNGTSDLYKNSDPWYSFLHRVELNTDVPGIPNTTIQILSNPVKNTIIITGFTGVADIKLFDVNGKVCVGKTITSGETILLEAVPMGVYVLKVATPNGILIQKIVKN